MDCKCILHEHMAEFIAAPENTFLKSIVNLDGWGRANSMFVGYATLILSIILFVATLLLLYACHTTYYVSFSYFLIIIISVLMFEYRHRRLHKLYTLLKCMPAILPITFHSYTSL